MDIINTIAVTVIIVWALWCWVSPDIHDGIIGKCLFLMLSLAALGALNEHSLYSETILNVAVALLAVRHWWMRTYFARFSDGALRILRGKGHQNKQE